MEDYDNGGNEFEPDVFKVGVNIYGVTNWIER